MSAQNARERLLEVCRQQAARFGKSIELMRGGKMSTHGKPGDPNANTTEETIAEFELLKAELEGTIARVEEENA